MRSAARRILVVLVSAAVAMAAAEMFLRVRYEPSRFLSPVLLHDDPALPHRIAPNSAGHDAWGFRNASVPSHADIVAVGDSLTYGYAARADESWPRWLERITTRSVYNAGVGGYGPPDYLEVLHVRALTLHPSLVIVGFYFGNDLYDTFERVETEEHWRGMRDPAAPGTLTFSPATADRSIVKPWLQTHSALYGLIESSAAVAAVNAMADRARAAAGGGCYVESRAPFPTAFTPEDRMRALDRSSAAIREGLRLTLAFFDEMRAAAASADSKLLVVLLPTKESVFDGRMDERGDPSCLATARRVVENERQARETITRHLHDAGIDAVDVLPALQNAVRGGRERLFLRSGDSHPNGNGYRVIAEAVASHVQGI